MQGAGTQALLSLIERDWDTFVESAAHAWLGWPEGGEGRLAADWVPKARPHRPSREPPSRRLMPSTSPPTRPGVRCPALVLHRRSMRRVIRFDLSAELALGALPNGRLEMLPGASAKPVLRGWRPRVVDRLIRFLKRSLKGGASDHPPPQSGRRRARGSEHVVTARDRGPSPARERRDQ